MIDDLEYTLERIKREFPHCLKDLPEFSKGHEYGESIKNEDDAAIGIYETLKKFKGTGLDKYIIENLIKAESILSKGGKFNRDNSSKPNDGFLGGKL